MLTRNRFDHQLEELNLITGTQNIIILKVNFMLPHSTLMVAGFHFKAHLGQDIDNLATGVIRQIGWRQIKVAPLVIDLKGRIAMFVQLKEEEFWLRTKVKG